MAVDVIVVGSGFGGAWAARELAENGLKVKIFEAGELGDELACHCARRYRLVDEKEGLAPVE